MATPLKHLVATELVEQLANNIHLHMTAFDRAGFMQRFQDQYLDLELMPRCHLIADCLHDFLPSDYLVGIEVIMNSLGPVHPSTSDFSDISFLHLPFSLYVGKYGLDHFQTSMHAQYEITQRFSAEFSIRAFIERYPNQCFKLFETWVQDPNPHIRRLVSEGTRPRLPWASRLRDLQADPTPLLPILEALKDDPDLYVRRSVANNLNDIGKDHPQWVYKLLAQWQKTSNTQRDWVINHALRSAVKRCEPEALALLGYTGAKGVALSNQKITPDQTAIGTPVAISTTLSNHGKITKALMVDFAVHYIKANGKPRPKVFKWKQMEMAPGSSKALSKKLNLSDLSTRTHYAGEHRVDIIINGEWFELGTFELSK